MKKIIALLLVISTIFALFACTKSEPEVIESEEPRENEPEVSLTDLDMLVGGNTEFAFDLYDELKGTDGNFFYSPYSISQALGMTWAGARGTTETAMAETLHFTLPQDRLHPAFNALDLELDKRNVRVGGESGEGFKLNIVNALWGQKDYEFLPAFLDTLSLNYGAGLRAVDFVNESEKSRVTINDWVSEQTEERIKDLIPEGVINAYTRLVLTNAVYFKAAWRYRFEPGNTVDGSFNLPDGDKVTVPMMRQTESFRYGKGNTWQAVELPYDGAELSMLIIMPDSGKFAAFEDELDAGLIDNIFDTLEYQEVALAMPKYEFTSSFGLKAALAKMGMEVAFTDAADFTGMHPQGDLFIQDILHKAFVKVDETGTEAAAATAVIVGQTSAPAVIIDLTIDNPFIFLIQDIETGTVIFAGRVVNPAG